MIVRVDGDVAVGQVAGVEGGPGVALAEVDLDEQVLPSEPLRRELRLRGGQRPNGDGPDGTWKLLGSRYLADSQKDACESQRLSNQSRRRKKR